MDAKREFLESQVSIAESDYDVALSAAKSALEALDVAVDDITTWRKALEKYTRESESPYMALPAPDPWPSLLAGRVAVEQEEAKPEPKRERPKRAESRPMPPKFSKRGAVRDFLKAQNEPLGVSEIHKRLPQQDYPEPITKNDLYRILPYLYSTEEINRDAKGRYFVGESTADSNNGNHWMDGIFR